MAKEKNKGKYFVDSYGNIHSGEIETPIGRALYVSLDKPNAYQPDKPTYGLTLLIPKTEQEKFSKEEIDKAQSKIDAIVTYAKDVISEHPKAKLFDPKAFLKDGDEKTNSDGDVRSEFKGHWYITLNNSKVIPVCDRYRKDLSPESIKAGMKVRAMAKLVASTPSGVARVSLKPTFIQLVEDDGTFLGKRDSRNSFSDDLDSLPVSDMVDQSDEESGLDDALDKI